jgi:osmotically-inducible protein OsmY
MRTHSLILTMAVTTGLLMAAPAPAVHSKPAAKSTAGRQPARVPKPTSDEALAAEIRSRFARSKINAEHFRVRVEKGVAILEGKTSVIQRKGTATRLAKLAGAAKVKNLIEVPASVRMKAKENLAQGRRRAQVKRDQR